MSQGHEARNILRGVRSGSLATMAREGGYPYVSFCAMGHDFRGNPIFLFSDLADHTQNIAANRHVSFLCEEASHLSNPQAGARVTLVGQMTKITEGPLGELFLQAHPSARMYEKFEDFNFYTLQIEKVHLIAGFGQAVWLDATQYLGDSGASLEFLEYQTGLLETIEQKFPTFAEICATKLLKSTAGEWKVLRVDGDGIDLKRSAKILRYPFEKPLKNPDQVLQFIHQVCQ